MSKILTSPRQKVEKLTATGGTHIGTSGWHYRHWRRCYYPPGLPADKWLTWYAKDFDCVEINNSFYKLPPAETIGRWCTDTPAGFLFAVKASRLITHLKKLKDCEEPLAVFLERISHFGPKLGPVLFQLPPYWHVNLARLETFLDLLPAHCCYSFEFRDPSWHCSEVYELLRSRNIGLCLFDLAGMQPPEVITARLIYVRLHGPGAAYCGSYSDATLTGWAAKIHRWTSTGRHVYVFFDNDQAGHAINNAKRLIELLRTKRPSF